MKVVSGAVAVLVFSLAGAATARAVNHPAGSPAWNEAREAVIAYCEAHEKRKDCRLALPHLREDVQLGCRKGEPHFDTNGGEGVFTSAGCDAFVSATLKRSEAGPWKVKSVVIVQAEPPPPPERHVARADSDQPPPPAEHHVDSPPPEEPPPDRPVGQRAGAYDIIGPIGFGGTIGAAGFGPSAKFMFAGVPLSVQVMTGVGWWGVVGWVLNADLLYEGNRFLNIDFMSMNWYIGGGPTIGIGNACGFAAAFCPGADVFFGGAQVVGGVAIQFRHSRWEATAELRPTFGGRAYFGTATGFAGLPAAYSYLGGNFWYDVGFQISGRYFF